MKAELSQAGDVCDFTVDPAVIRHLIYNQGSDETKALLELIMNSIDAGARSISVTVTENGFRCFDDGKGFRTRPEIERHFQRFGTPHLEGDAIYGRYRLGRGQIMAFAKTVWKSHQWLMTVDIQATGLNFRLQEQSTQTEGCGIDGTWYRAKTAYDVSQMVQDLSSKIRFIPYQVHINGKALGNTKQPDFWTFEDEDAFYRIDRNSRDISIYNMGVFVSRRAAADYGFGGIIVSKSALSLNTSRTQVMDGLCPVWTRIEDRLCAQSREPEKTARWNRSRKEWASRQIRWMQEEALELVRTAPLVSLVGSTRSISLGTLLFGQNADFKVRRPRYTSLTVCPSIDQIVTAENIARSCPDTAVLHPSMIGLFGSLNDWELGEFIMEARHEILKNATHLKDVLPRSSSWVSALRNKDVIPLTEMPVIPFSELASSSGHLDINFCAAKDVLKPEEQRVWGSFKRSLEIYANRLFNMASPQNYEEDYEEDWHRSHRTVHDRRFRLLLGSSQSALAWTDGKSYIAVSAALVRQVSTNPVQHAQELFQTIEHEVVHALSLEGDTSLTLEHDLKFYRTFHDLTLSNAALRQTMIRKALKNYRMTLSLRKNSLLEDGPGRTRLNKRYSVSGAAADKDALLGLELLISAAAIAEDLSLEHSPELEDEASDLISTLHLGKKQCEGTSVRETLNRAVKHFHKRRSMEFEAAHHSLQGTRLGSGSFQSTYKDLIDKKAIEALTRALEIRAMRGLVRLVCEEIARRVCLSTSAYLGPSRDGAGGLNWIFSGLAEDLKRLPTREEVAHRLSLYLGPKVNKAARPIFNRLHQGPIPALASTLCKGAQGIPDESALEDAGMRLARCCPVSLIADEILR